MSANLKTQENFIRLILETTATQALILLKNPTNSQVNTLSEISKNLLTLDFPKKYEKAIKSSKFILKQLSKRASYTTKINVIKKYAKRILSILLLIKDCLLHILS